jgi:hypothetical protein
VTSRQRVKRAILFQRPDKIPAWLPAPHRSDILDVYPDSDPNWQPKIKTETRWEDEWGCLWAKPVGDKTIGQVIEHPLIDYSRMDKLKFPDYAVPERYTKIRRLVKENREEKFVMAATPLSLLHRLEFLRGHEAPDLS